MSQAAIKRIAMGVVTMQWIFMSLSLISLISLLPPPVECELNFSTAVENTKDFKSVPTTIKTFENDTVLLPCYHSSVPFRYVRWHRDDVLLADSRQPDTPPPARIHLWSNGSLQVSNLRAEDTGDYYCETMTNTGHAVQIHAIEVQYSPTIVSEPSGVVELPLGAMFEIVCETKGVPQPAITWRHNGKTLEQYHIGNRQSHLVDVTSRHMSGPLECLATNGVGEPAVAGVFIQVLFTPEVRATPSVVYTKNNLRSQLECTVVAAPPATVHWLHHGVPVTIDSRLSRFDIELQFNRSEGNFFTETKHVLTIKKVRDSDLGLYECRAENKIGFKGASIDLTGRPMPCVFKINPGVQSSASHVLVWQTESLSPVMEFKLRFRQIPSGNVTPQNHVQGLEWTELTIPAELSVGPIYTTSYTLRGLQPASVYEVAVLARNHFGWSDNSKIVRFATGGEVELPNYSTESGMDENQIDDDVEASPSSPTYKAGIVGRSGAEAEKRSSKKFFAFIMLAGLLWANAKI